MELHFHISDYEFEEQFETGKLKPEIFTHEAHLRLAWIHLKKYRLENAISNIRSQLSDYVSLLGVADKYNETLTVAAIRAIDHFMRQSNTDTFKEFITAYPQLKDNFKELMQQHYQFDIFNSPEAKTSFIEPDLLPFD